MTESDDFEEDFWADMNEITTFTVSGIIINDPNGPLRWSEDIQASSARMAEDIARMMVSSQVTERRHGVLLVANVFQIVHDKNGNADIKPMDTYAVYADDPDRPDGYKRSDWKPPEGFEGKRAETDNSP